MSLETMKSLIDQAASKFGTIYRVQFTGGECMLNYEDVLHAARYAYDKHHYRCTVLSNAFWAVNEEVAEEKMRELSKAGVDNIVISTGEEHQRTVPLERCIFALKAAVKEGVLPNIRMEYHNGLAPSKAILEADEEIKRLLDNKRIKFEAYHWQGFSNETIRDKGYKSRYANFTPDPCEDLMKDAIITPYGDMLACCGVACTRIPFLRLGNVFHEDMGRVLLRGYDDALKIWLMVEGPYGIYNYVVKHSRIQMESGWGRCDVCLKLFADPRVLLFLKSTYHDWYYRVKYQFDKFNNSISHERKS